MKFSFPSSWFFLVLATPSALVVAKKGKKTKNTKNKNTVVPIVVREPNRNCDPMSPYDDVEWGCKNKDCASDRWKDGCEACMCYSQGNASWCDGTKSAYYDNYFEEHGMNPFGDSNRSNRKCNTQFSQLDAPCQMYWECEYGLGCYLASRSSGGDRKCCHYDRRPTGSHYCIVKF